MEIRMYLLAIDGNLTKYPYNIADLRNDNQGTSFPDTMPDERLAEWDVLPVVPTEQPVFDPATEACREIDPVCVDGVWSQQWEVIPYTPPVPDSVTPRQIRQALNRIGLRQAVEAAVAAGDQDVKDWWEFATEFQRSHPMVIAMGQGLGKTEEEIDDLWRLAGSL
jgi:hypothetical protein